MKRNMGTEYISPAERTSIRLLLDKHCRGASPAQTMALLNEIDRLESLLRAAAEPEAKPYAPCDTCGGVRLVRSSAGNIYDTGKPCPACCR